MMKIEAYKCDYCNTIYEPEQIKGVKNETDLFESSLSYPTGEAHKTEAHFCLECYRINVDIHVKNKMQWKEGEKFSEERQQLKFDLHRQFFFIFKKEVIRRNLAGKNSLKKTR